MDDFISTEGPTFAIEDSEIPKPDIKAQPLSINFYWESRSVTVSLVNGKDILLLATVFANILDDAGIEYTLAVTDEQP